MNMVHNNIVYHRHRHRHNNYGLSTVHHLLPALQLTNKGNDNNDYNITTTVYTRTLRVERSLDSPLYIRRFDILQR